MKFDSKNVTLFAVFAALYSVINILQMSLVGNPTIYGPIRLRVADCLIALTVLFGWPVVGGVTFGCLVTNARFGHVWTGIVLKSGPHPLYLMKETHPYKKVK